MFYGWRRPQMPQLCLTRQDGQLRALTAVHDASASSTVNRIIPLSRFGCSLHASRFEVPFLLKEMQYFRACNPISDIAGATCQSIVGVSFHNGFGNRLRVSFKVLRSN